MMEFNLASSISALDLQKENGGLANRQNVVCPKKKLFSQKDRPDAILIRNLYGE